MKSSLFLLLVVWTSIAAAAQQSPGAPAPQPAAPGATAASAPAASVFGVTAWMDGVSGAEAGVALPLAAWPSLFWRLGQGELVALIGERRAGLGLGHKFRSVKLDFGGASLGAAVGVGVVVRRKACEAPDGPRCREGLRGAKVVAFVTFPIVAKGSGS